MPKLSVKSNNHHNHLHHTHHNTSNSTNNPQSNHHSSHNSNHINSPDDSCNNGNVENGNTPHLQMKDAAKRLKKKLRLQEMRCNLMSNKMVELKASLSAKKRQIRMIEKRAKDEEKKRRDEEKKFKDMEQEFSRLRKENDQIKESLARNENTKSTTSTATATTSTFDQQLNRPPQTSTPIPKNQFPQVSLPNTTTVPNGSTKNKNSKQIKKSVALEESKPLIREVTVPMILENNGNSSSELITPSKPSSSKDLRVNEGASCSGLNGTPTTYVHCTDTSKPVINANGVNHFLGTSKLEDLFENELMCAICHELYIKPVALSCTHIFCTFCIAQWRKKAHKCPICRDTIVGKAPQHVLENVIEKVVSTMDDESKKRRSDVIKDRPVPTASNERNPRHAQLLMPLGDDFDGWDRDMSDYTDSESNMHSYSSPLPAYGDFMSDSDLDSSDIDDPYRNRDSWDPELSTADDDFEGSSSEDDDGDGEFTDYDSIDEDEDDDVHVVTFDSSDGDNEHSFRPGSYHWNLSDPDYSESSTYSEVDSERDEDEVDEVRDSDEDEEDDHDDDSLSSRDQEDYGEEEEEANYYDDEDEEEDDGNDDEDDDDDSEDEEDEDAYDPDLPYNESYESSEGDSVWEAMELTESDSDL